LNHNKYEPEPDSDDEDSESDSDFDEPDNIVEGEEYDSEDSPSRKRKPRSNSGGSPAKRRKIDEVISEFTIGASLNILLLEKKSDDP
jgi:hypothetical protein